MSFRRSKEGARRAARWSRFKQEAARWFEESGLPAHVHESEAHFQDLLMHGYLDHHARPYPFRVADLSAPQRRALRQLVVAYLSAGFGDPGLSLFGSEEDEAIRREVRGGAAKPGVAPGSRSAR